MTNQIYPPPGSDPGAVQPPMMYVQKELTWEYKRIDRPLEGDQLLNDDELNALGAEGWELTTSVTTGEMVYFYLRRPKP